MKYAAGFGQPCYFKKCVNGAFIHSFYFKAVVHKSQLFNIFLSLSSFNKEIYAPKLQEFAYVTDGACSEDDIIKMELIVLKVMQWICGSFKASKVLDMIFCACL